MKKTIVEYCNNCEHEVKLINKFKKQTCPVCSSIIYPCSLCKTCITPCQLGSDLDAK